MTHARKISRLVEARGTHRTYELDDGSIEVWSGGTASWRHNNPGNLKYEFAGSADPTVHAHRSYEKALHAAQHAHAGVVALDPRGNAIFETPEAGRIAQLEVLQHRFKDLSVEAMVEKYSTKDYSGPTHHTAQLATIYRTGDKHGFDLRGRTISTLSSAELAALGEGIARFEGFHVGQVEVGGATHPSPWVATSPAHRPSGSERPSHAIYDEAALHFLAGPARYEYGRPDAPRPGRDTSRLERDGDGDGRLGVDCSAFVWRGLKNAGFDVSGNDASGFATHTLFDGRTASNYARKHFDVIAAEDARRPHGTLERGDLLLFSDGHSQHVGIFKGYDSEGRLQFIGSQGTSGPREVTIAPHTYWDGGTTHIVGALRAKPEFQTRAPLHGASHTQETPTRAPNAAGNRAPAVAAAVHPARPHEGHAPRESHDAQTAHATRHPGPHGDEAVRREQHALNMLGARDARGIPLAEDGMAGRHTREAVTAFQQDHGLPATGRVGAQTRAMLDRAHGLRITDTAHPDYTLFERTLGLVEAAEAAKGIPPGPHSANLAASLVVQMREAGLSRIDRVEIGEPPRYARAVQAAPDGRREHELMATVDVRTASSQSPHRSSDLLAQLAPPALPIAEPKVRTEAATPVLSR
jgi:hypothetical protein